MDKTILIVEDDPKSIKLVNDLLQISGYRTLLATDGRQGVIIAGEKKPDLILMDIMMPRLDGYSACSELKMGEATRRIPVIMLTAVDFELNRKLARQVGADGYLTKPVDRQKLLNALSPFLSSVSKERLT